jgi:hypothetical protein
MQEKSLATYVNSGSPNLVQLLVMVICVFLAYSVSAQDADKDPQTQSDDLPISSAVGNLLPATDDQWRF